MKSHQGWIALVAILILLGSAAWLLRKQFPIGSKPAGFDGQAALEDVKQQVGFGPRLPGSQAHAQTVAYICSQLEKSGWSVEVQDTSWNGTPVQNVIAKHGSGSPWIILGAHYDTREWADQDPNPANRAKPVPGANDGASGVAVLLELARSLPNNLHGQIWLVFFDMEDDGGINGQDWIMGSQAFVSQLSGKPDAAVIVDMVGDANLNIYKERNSTPALTDQIWQSAAQLGYDGKFIPKYRYSMEDDHTPFLAAGIPAVDIIDFDYPYWHTVQDTVDKVSATSLQTVGDVLYHWLVEK